MDIPGLPARKAALKLLDAVLRRGETLDQAAQPALQGVRAYADRALARALAGEALRWLIDLDALIDSATRQILPEDAKPRMALRLMLAGWLRLETPPHAVIATGLPLLAGGPRRLAHGVFSTLVKRGVTLPAVPTLPTKVLERWGERAGAVAAGLAVPPPLDLTLRDPATSAEWAERLGGTSLLPGHVRLERGTAVERLEGFKDGAWWVQDLAASLPARLLGPGEGRTVLDLCAAPGGKTMQLAAAGWQVTALDAGAKRLQRMQENLTRTGLSAELVQADALQWEPAGPFDAVLLDAPCTATGTCRRHPDVLHRIGPRQVAELAQLQAALLERAQRWVKPGGHLVYATCSLEREEGEDQAVTVTLTPDPIRGEELPANLTATDEGWLRTDPGLLADLGGLDGFFIARWQC
ncbi:RsmB/NOP family class I SAM-dependent RNA methyltransferase [Novosphingobium ginsenosidimutans]|uniref:RsmB/NOP family class I SAM-dependent RNA methyltransferase n=1 Tax=Novosphingobium ginsenosidimutans TaxID=1176536 RepID=A0A5B8S2D7_9SPHN|nr:RsmB/NOP family class I SAM-dependent RNA methyltransferase [Novosphingobium ginsenosidimutans]QEA15304.1 RsmB/NOP family class I SAM-dependent RNA methyltransferase [Novosphingobium ginsenosidimutans]